MKKLLVAVALTAGLASCATTTSPTGQRQYNAVSDQQLAQMGAQAFQEYKQKLPQSTDAAQNRYVQCVVNSLVSQIPAESRTGWETAVFVNKEPNAFALPGGKVGVYTGIFQAARNQDQLAGVIAHEIGHVLARHHNDRISRQLGSQQLVGILGAVVGAHYGQTAGQIAQGVGSMTAQGAFLLPNSRAQETEADVIGQQLMAAAGFDPRQAVNLWQNMVSISGSNRPAEWMSTHPNPQTRISELQNRAAGLMPRYEEAQKKGLRPRCG